MAGKQESRVAHSRRFGLIPEFQAEVELQVPTTTILRLVNDPACRAGDTTELVEVAAMLALTEWYVDELMYSGELIGAIENAHCGQELELIIANLERLLLATSAKIEPSSRRDKEDPDTHVPYLTRVDLESLIESRKWHDGMLWEIHDFEVAEVALLRDLITCHLMRTPEELFVEAIRRCRRDFLGGSEEWGSFNVFQAGLQRLLSEARGELEAIEAA